MKKITSFLMLFLMCFGNSVWAGPTNLPILSESHDKPHYYVINSMKNNKLVQYAGDNADMKLVELNADAEKLDANLFYFIGTVQDNGVLKVKIYNKSTGSAKACSNYNSWTKDGIFWYIANRTISDKYGVSVSQADVPNCFNSWNDASGFGQKLGEFYAKDGGSQFYIYDPLEMQKVNVTCNYYIDGVLSATKKTEQRVNETLEVPSLNNNYISKMKIRETGRFTVETKELNADCTETGLPFIKSKDFSSGVWYYMTIHGDKYYLNYEKDAQKMDLNRKTTPKLPEVLQEKDMWCFVGNTLTGFKIYNKEAGSGMILSAPTAFTQGDGQHNLVLLRNEHNLDTKTYNTTWDFSNSDKITGVKGYFFNMHGVNDYWLNRRDGLAFWNGQDGGSTIQLEKVVAIQDVLAQERVLENLVGGYTTTQLNDLENNPTYVDLSALMKSPRIAIGDDGYFQIVFTRHGRVVGNPTAFANGAGEVSEDPVSKHVITNCTDLLPTMWSFVSAGENNAQEKLYMFQNANSGFYLYGEVNSQYETIKTTKDAAKFTVEGGEGGVFALKHDGKNGYNYLNIMYNENRPNNNEISYWSGGTSDIGNRIQFKKVVSIPLTITDAQWATVNLPFAVKVAEGVNAYYVTSVKGDAIYVSDVTGVIPANTPVLLKATTANTYNFEIAKETGNAVQGNKLVGTTVKRTGVAEKSYYGMMKNESENVVFAPYTGDMKANKAFLPAKEVKSSAKSLYFVFGEPTGVEGVEVENENSNVYYDLSGRRVLYPAKGIFVNSNGQKVIFK